MGDAVSLLLIDRSETVKIRNLRLLATRFNCCSLQVAQTTITQVHKPSRHRRYGTKIA